MTDNGEPEPGWITLDLRMPRRLLDAVEARARAEGRALSDVVAVLLRHYGSGQLGP